jgi:hypothetical protein
MTVPRDESGKGREGMSAWHEGMEGEGGMENETGFEEGGCGNEGGNPMKREGREGEEESIFRV